MISYHLDNLHLHWPFWFLSQRTAVFLTSSVEVVRYPSVPAWRRASIYLLSPYLALLFCFTDHLQSASTHGIWPFPLPLSSSDFCSSFSNDLGANGCVGAIISLLLFCLDIMRGDACLMHVGKSPSGGILLYFSCLLRLETRRRVGLFIVGMECSRFLSTLLCS